MVRTCSNALSTSACHLSPRSPERVETASQETAADKKHPNTLLGPLSLGPQRGLYRVWPTGICPWLLSPQVLALIVFSCIFGEGYSNTHQSEQLYCVFNKNEDACRYGSAIGVLAFLASAFFLVVDAFFSQISNATDRKYLVVGDLLFSGMPVALEHWGFKIEGPWDCWEGLLMAPQGHEPHLSLALGPPVPWVGTQAFDLKNSRVLGIRVRHGFRFLGSSIPPS